MIYITINEDDAVEIREDQHGLPDGAVEISEDQKNGLMNKSMKFENEKVVPA